MAHPDLSAEAKEFKLQTDASINGIAAVLIQEQDGKERVISYVSRPLRRSELAYTIREWEALAIMFGCEQNYTYLHGRHFSVHTDHESLKWLNDERRHGRILRWATRLSPFRFDIHHIPGKRNSLADVPSRMPVEYDNDRRQNEALEQSMEERMFANGGGYGVNPEPNAEEAEENEKSDRAYAWCNRELTLKRYEKIANDKEEAKLGRLKTTERGWITVAIPTNQDLNGELRVCNVVNGRWTIVQAKSDKFTFWTEAWQRRTKTRTVRQTNRTRTT